ncbi:hypothetical protein GCK32_006302 [Trichostrongylus colubriformis]|uniref:Uncharacterized protein n=1 Tax=Trichostrongylus colubriformis TaxID=6319 RepID=A0AAN8J2F3_TRICO
MGFTMNSKTKTAFSMILDFFLFSRFVTTGRASRKKCNRMKCILRTSQEHKRLMKDHFDSFQAEISRMRWTEVLLFFTISVCVIYGHNNKTRGRNLAGLSIRHEISQSIQTKSALKNLRAVLFCHALSRSNHLKTLLQNKGSIASIKFSTAILTQSPETSCSPNMCLLKGTSTGNKDFVKLCRALQAAAVESAEIAILLKETYKYKKTYSSTSGHKRYNKAGARQKVFLNSTAASSSKIWTRLKSTTSVAVPSTTAVVFSEGIIFTVPDRTREIAEKRKHKRSWKLRISIEKSILIGIIGVMLILSISILIYGCVRMWSRKKK